MAGWIFFFWFFFVFPSLKKEGRKGFSRALTPALQQCWFSALIFFFLELFAAAVLTECVGDWFLLHFLKN